MPSMPLDEAIASWLPREVRGIEETYGGVVTVTVPRRPARSPERLLEFHDPNGVGPRAEAFLYEASEDGEVVHFTVFLQAIVPRALPRRVHLWGADLRWTAGVVELVDWKAPGRAASPLKEAALGPGIRRLIDGDYEFRLRSNPFRRESGRPYGSTR